MTTTFISRTSRRAVIAAAFAAGALILTGCGEKSEPTPSAQTSAAPAAGASAAKDDLLARVMKKGEITIATEGTWAPWTYHDEKNALTGFDVELGRQIAAKLGVKAHFIEGKWDGLLAGISAGRFDIMINGVDVTPVRSKAFLFTEPYAFNRTVVMTKTDSEKVKRLDELKRLTTANTISSTYAEIAEAHGAKVTGVDDLNQTFELLLSGRIDATLNAEVTYHDYMRAHPDAQIKIAAVDPDVIPVAIPMKPGEDSASMKAKLDEIIEGMRKSGELGTLSKNFFVGDLTQR